MLKLVMQSQNRKLVGVLGATFNWSPRPVAAVMRAVGPTCPSGCAFLQDRSCYALQGPVHWQSKGALPDAGDAEQIRAFIRSLPPRWLLRHNVSGDFFRDGAVDAAYLDAVLAAHAERPDVQGWAYTHDWAALEAAGYTAERLRAGGLVVNASCDTPEQAREAASRGWLTVTTAPSGDTRRRWRDGTLDVVTCPADTVGVACNSCLLCARADRTVTVAFRHHGSRARRADERLAALAELPMAGD